MRPTDQEIIEACQFSITMAKAATKLGIAHSTLKGRAVKLGVYDPNQGAKGTKKKDNGTKIPLNEILEGLHPTYPTNKLKHRLFNEGIKEQRCEVCTITEWNGLPLSLELDHIDGDRHNHKLDNLRIICPNCHSQTETYRGRNIGKY